MFADPQVKHIGIAQPMKGSNLTLVGQGVKLSRTPSKLVAPQAGNNHPTSIPTGVFKTTDGHINIAAAGQAIWRRTCEALGVPDMAKRPEYANGAERLKHRDALNAEIEAITVTKSSDAWVDRFNEIGVPCGPIYSIDQVFADPQVKHLGIAKPVKNSKLTLVGQGVKLSRTPSKLVAWPPAISQHTDAVLKEFGFKANEIAALRKANAI